VVTNTYGRKVGGRIWQDHRNMLLVGPPIHAKRRNTEADMRCNLKSTTELFPDSVEKGMPDGGASDSPSGCTSSCEVHASKCDSEPAPKRAKASKNRERSRQKEGLRLAQYVRALTQQHQTT
jgi:hypothetical protein